MPPIPLNSQSSLTKIYPLLALLQYLLLRAPSCASGQLRMVIRHIIELIRNQLQAVLSHATVTDLMFLF